MAGRRQSGIPSAAGRRRASGTRKATLLFSQRLHPLQRRGNGCTRPWEHPHWGLTRHGIVRRRSPNSARPLNLRQSARFLHMYIYY